MKKLVSVFLAACMLGSTVFAAAPDVKGDANEKEITELFDLGILNGYEDGTFRPANTFTRAEFAKIICQVLKAEEGTQSQNVFDDCNGHWAEKYINYCYYKGIINGVSSISVPESVYSVEIGSDGKPVGTEVSKTEMLFAPDRALKLDEALKIAVGFIGHATSADNLNYPKSYRTKAIDLKLVESDEDFEGYISRSRAAKLVYDAMRLPTITATVSENGETVYNISDALIENFK